MRENGVYVNKWPIGDLVEIARLKNHSKNFEPFVALRTRYFHIT